MSNDKTAAMANAIAEPLGDIVVAFLLIVKTLRKQPGFNDDVFTREIEALLQSDDLSQTQRNILASLLWEEWIMTADKLSDAEAKQILQSRPTRTIIWPPPGGTGYWLQAQPRFGTNAGPRISSPSATQFRTQPDGLWAFFHSFGSCDLVAVEVCGTIQNLNDKRSRYIPSSHSLVLSVSMDWFNHAIAIQGGG
jgi:hypothetical protein